MSGLPNSDYLEVDRALALLHEGVRLSDLQVDRASNMDRAIELLHEAAAILLTAAIESIAPSREIADRTLARIAARDIQPFSHPFWWAALTSIGSP